MAYYTPRETISPLPWRVVPTRRRTSKPDRADILDATGCTVAAYIYESDAQAIVEAVNSRQTGGAGYVE